MYVYIIICSSDWSLFVRALLCPDRMKTVEISRLHRPSLPIVHVSSVKLAQSEQENLSKNNKKKKI